MKLCKNSSNNTTHILNPKYYNFEASFCGLIGAWPYRENGKELLKKSKSFKFFNGTPDQVNCSTCKVMAHNYILRKLKGETYG